MIYRLRYFSLFIIIAAFTFLGYLAVSSIIASFEIDSGFFIWGSFLMYVFALLPVNVILGIHQLYLRKFSKSETLTKSNKYLLIAYSVLNVALFIWFAIIAESTT